MSKTDIARILVAVKPRERGLPLEAYHARYLADGLGAEVLLLSCVVESAFAMALESPDAAAAREKIVARERERLEPLAKSLRDWGTTVTTRVIWESSVHEGILREAREWDAHLVVVGAHRSRLAPHTVFTDTDWQLMRLCPCPLLLVKDPDFEGYQSVLATVDPLHRHAEPSGLDRAVLETAKAVSDAFGSKLRVAHAYPDPEGFVYASAVEVSPGVWYGAENIEHVHRRAVTELASYYGVVPEQLDLRPGEPVDVVADIVAEHDVKLLVVGAVQRGRIEQAVVGSTAEWLAAEVPCDLLLVKPPSGG